MLNNTLQKIYESEITKLNEAKSAVDKWSEKLLNKKIGFYKSEIKKEYDITLKEVGDITDEGLKKGIYTIKAKLSFFERGDRTSLMTNWWTFTFNTKTNKSDVEDR